MKIKFIKMHGLGNDFAIFDGRGGSLDIPLEKIRRWGDRRTGIGFDQLAVIDPAKTAEADCSFRIYNADGGEVGACGNVTRCIAWLLMNEIGKDTVVMETKAGRLEVFKSGDKVQVDMGQAILDWKNIPLKQEESTLSLSIAEGVLSNPVAVSMGNPHAVFFVEDVSSVPLETLGPKIEHHPLFPERTNVEAAQVLSKDKIRMRVWERGVGITQACGTGACAVAVAGVRRGLTDRKVSVILDGGTLDIEWRESDNHVLMTGPVAEVYRGEIEL